MLHIHFVEIQSMHYRSETLIRQNLLLQVHQEKHSILYTEHKFFNFLKTAFEESPWMKIKKFKFKNNSNKEYHIDYVYWEYFLSGYVLKILCHQHYDESDFSKKSHGIYIIKNINCLEIDEKILDFNDIDIVTDLSAQINVSRYYYEKTSY